MIDGDVLISFADAARPHSAVSRPSAEALAAAGVGWNSQRPSLPTQLYPSGDAAKKVLSAEMKKIFDSLSEYEGGRLDAVHAFREAVKDLLSIDPGCFLSNTTYLEKDRAWNIDLGLDLSGFEEEQYFRITVWVPMKIGLFLPCRVGLQGSGMLTVGFGFPSSPFSADALLPNDTSLDAHFNAAQLVVQDVAIAAFRTHTRSHLLDHYEAAMARNGFAQTVLDEHSSLRFEATWSADEWRTTLDLFVTLYPDRMSPDRFATVKDRIRKVFAPKVDEQIALIADRLWLERELTEYSTPAFAGWSFYLDLSGWGSVSMGGEDRLQVGSRMMKLLADRFIDAEVFIDFSQYHYLLSTVKDAEGESTVSTLGSKHVLYRMFDGRGRLLYVGRTASFLTRIGQHALDKAWMGEVASMKLEHFRSAVELDEAERHTIKDEDPLYNRQRPEPRTPRRPKSQSRSAA